MENKFDRLKSYVNELGFEIASENTEEEILLITDESRGISNLVIDIEDPIIIFEQLIGIVRNESLDIYKRLLQANRVLVHGAFVLDVDSNRLLFRDTLQVENLDLNEIEGTITSLSLAMAEHSRLLIETCK